MTDDRRPIEHDAQTVPAAATASSNGGEARSSFENAPRADDLARRIAATRAGSPSNLMLGLWSLWFALIAVAAFATGSPLLMLSAALAAWTGRALSQRADAAIASTSLPDIGHDCLGPLLELLGWPSNRIREVARWRIGALLRTLPEGRPICLSRVQLASLYDALTPAMALRHPWFVESVLRALPAIADAQALPAVLRLAQMWAWAPRLRRIRDAARAALPGVEQRILALREAGDEAGTAEEDHDTPNEEMARRTYGEELGDRPQMRFAFLIAAYAGIVPACLYQASSLASNGRWLDASVYTVIALAATQLYRFTMLSRHGRMVRELMNEDSVEAIGRLAEAAVWPDARIRAAAVSALTRLLPRLKASDSRLLTPAQRECLYVFLNPAQARAFPEMAAALLQALEQVGDMAAVPHVRTLAQMSPRSARLSAIRDAARQCLPALMERARLNTDHQILLRPAEAPGPPEETLLRPVMPGTPSTDVTLLVRPANAKNDRSPESET
jgi:hypothetical protein